MRISSIIFIIKILKIFGFGRGFLKKYLYNILNKYSENLPIKIFYKNFYFETYPLENSTEAKMITSSRMLEKVELKYLKNLKKSNNSIFVDIGGNIGYYSIMASNFGFDKIYCFEPLENLCLRIEKNILLNNLQNKIQVINKAVDESSQKASIFVSKENLGNSSMIIDSVNSEMKNIETTTLFEFLESNNIKKIDAIKIDIEGYEDRALLPYLKQIDFINLPKLVIIEHVNKKHWKTDVINYMKDNGYRIIKYTRGNTILRID